MSRYHHRNKAGNFADVHKHWLLTLLLQHRPHRSRPLCYIETHAGSGCYRLGNEAAAHTSGIERLWHVNATLPDSLRRYLGVVQQSNPAGTLCHYPGSPLIAQHFLQPEDRGVLYEIQQDILAELASALAGDTRFTSVPGNGYTEVARYLNNMPGDALVLIDPPYREENDFQAIIQLLEVLPLCEQNIQLATWYPLFSDSRHTLLRETLQKRYGELLWGCELQVEQTGGSGMYGSGMLLLNPPVPLHREAEADGAALARVLGGEMRYWRPSNRTRQ